MIPATRHKDKAVRPQMRSVYLLTLLLTVAANIGAAAPAFPPVTLPNSELRTLESRSTGRTYDLYIRKPADYDKDTSRKYPVLYLLDGQWHFKLLDAVIGGLVYDKWMPDIIVVAITYHGDKPDYEALRAMDYTPSPGPPKGSGDAPKFLKFIKTEVIPFAETNYRADPTRRILGGHSLGGLFSLYAMFTEPTLFWGYLSGSPAIPWDNGYLIKQEQNYFEQHKDLPVRLFMAAGGAEELMTPGLSFARTLASRNYTGLHWDGRIVEGERHAGVLPEYYNRGLRFIFSPQ
jgi:predicted alpha/beta superfamily hydrolase